MDSREIERVALSILEEHGCHTTLLYGSRARGDATASSDVDLVGVRDEGPSVRDARVVEGVYFDVFVYPAAALEKLEPSLLRLLGAVVLRERGDFGTALLARLKELHERGPTPLPDDERRAVVLWSRKMLDRFRGDRGIEASYRRMFLVLQALEDYFALRNMWFGGSKEAFSWLREHDQAAYGAFERAMQAGASDDVLAEVVTAVYGPGTAAEAPSRDATVESKSGMRAP